MNRSSGSALRFPNSLVPHFHVLLPSLIALGLLWAYQFPYYLHYFPSGDTPAVLQGSSASPGLWFSEGFSRYFLVYPEWAVPSTDFMRPMVNAIVKLSEMAFGNHYIFFFLTFFALQLGVCVLATMLARLVGLPRGGQQLVGLLCALNPAFVNEGLYEIAIQFDVWCGFFALAALVLIFKQRYVGATVLLTLAVLTKESALYAPIAAAISVFILSRRKVVSAIMFVPACLWVMARSFLFKGSMQGVYVLPGNSFRHLIRAVLFGIVVWPLATFEPHNLKLDIAQHKFPFDLIVVIGNVFIWGFLVVSLIALIRRIQRESTNAEPAVNDLEHLALFVWLFGALGLCVLMAPASRFGGSVYPLEIVVVLLSAYATTSLPLRFAARISVAILFLAFLSNAWKIVLHRSPDAADTQAAARDLVATIRHQKVDDIYILNSIPSYTSHYYLAGFAKTSSRLIILSETSGCRRTSVGSEISISRDETKITSKIPACSHYEFDNVPKGILAQGLQGELKRENIGTYRFPYGRVTQRSLADPNEITDLDFGSTMELAFQPPAGRSHVVLYYDWKTASYRCSGEACIGS
ncbi:MAG: hypothetical protein JST61_01790 [Acidobacteria bacterium]|nr:hypothetical protein [Acidobacteriota bacterium]